MMLDPAEPLETRVVKQAKIIDALIRRSNRQKDVGPSAFRAFQSAIELQERNARYALCTMCMGVGQGYATIIERV